MNKQRFIERLNLHLDGELSAEESEELFKAMRRSEEYQRIYAQYCQIYNACSLLGEGFADERKRQPVRQKLYAISGLAAAFALLALAAQNLAPVIGGSQQLAEVPSGGDIQLEVALPISTNAAPEERLVVLNAEELRGKPITIGSVELASFDVDAAFEASRDGNSYEDGVTFVSAKDTQPQNSETVRWRRPFLLEKAVPASTFEHEVLSARESAMSAFNEQQGIAARDALVADGEIRFDARRAEISPVRGIDSQVSAAAVNK